jgi:hypothetical protein
MSQEQADEFLRSFFNNELLFIASKSFQRQAWANASGDQFTVVMVLYAEAWFTLVKNRRECKLIGPEFQMLTNLHEMLEGFQIDHKFPTKPHEYQALMNHPDWTRIQQYAKDIYDRINPRLKISKTQQSRRSSGARRKDPQDNQTL